MFKPEKGSVLRHHIVVPLRAHDTRRLLSRLMVTKGHFQAIISSLFHYGGPRGLISKARVSASPETPLSAETSLAAVQPSERYPAESPGVYVTKDARAMERWLDCILQNSIRGEARGALCCEIDCRA